MKKIILEIPIPQYRWVKTPTLYSTPLGQVAELSHVKQQEALISYLQRHEDRKAIIEMEHRMLVLLCTGLVKEWLRYLPEVEVPYVAESLAGLLSDFRESKGWNFDEWKLTHRVLSNGKKIQFETFSQMFSNEADAYQHIAKIYTSGSDFKFTVTEDS